MFYGLPSLTVCFALLGSIPAWASLGLKSPGTLRFAADRESGAPYLYSLGLEQKLRGFEVEIMEAITQDLGLRPEFIQNNWDGLIAGLSRNDYDVAINGLEITPERQKMVAFTVPYFATHLRLTIRSADREKWNSLQGLRGHRVGTLGGAYSEDFLRSQPGIDSVLYASEASAHEDLRMGRIEGILLDYPIIKYYSEPHSDFLVLPEEYGHLEYGIAILKHKTELKRTLDQRIEALIVSGQLYEIVQRYGLDSDSLVNWLQARSNQKWHRPTPTVGSPPLRHDSEYQQFINKNQFTHPPSLRERITSYIPLLLDGAAMTLWLGCLSMLLASLIGASVAAFRLYAPMQVSWLGLLYVELIRGTPLLIQLFLLFYGLPHLGIELSPMTAAVLGLGLNYSACEAETFRAGLLSVGRAQREACNALGLSPWLAFWHIELPQSFRFVLPPMTNDFIALLKDTSLVSVITMVELTKASSQLASQSFDFFGPFLAAALLYLIMGLPFVRLSRIFEARLHKKHGVKIR